MITISRLLSCTRNIFLTQEIKTKIHQHWKKSIQRIIVDDFLLLPPYYSALHIYRPFDIWLYWFELDFWNKRDPFQTRWYKIHRIFSRRFVWLQNKLENIWCFVRSVDRFYLVWPSHNRTDAGLAQAIDLISQTHNHTKLIVCSIAKIFINMQNNTNWIKILKIQKLITIKMTSMEKTLKIISMFISVDFIEFIGYLLLVT